MIGRPARSPARTGRAAERVAADYYAARGFSVLATNARFGPLEADLVVKKGDMYAVVEVRARRPNALVGAFASLGAVKRRRLQRVASALWARVRGASPKARVRIDVASVNLWSKPVALQIVEGAFAASEGPFTPRAGAPRWRPLLQPCRPLAPAVARAEPSTAVGPLRSRLSRDGPASRRAASAV